MNNDANDRLPAPSFLAGGGVSLSGGAAGGDGGAASSRDVGPAISPDPLAELAKLISESPRTPEIGLQASKAMAQCFEATAVEVERVAQDAVDRAMSVMEEARSYAAVLRQSGALLCSKIEAEAARTRQIALVMHEARVRLAEPGTVAPGSSASN